MRRIILAVLVLCGCQSAEAKPFKGGRLLVRLGIVGEAYGWCDASAAWRLAHTEIVRVTRGAVPVDYLYDIAAPDDRPELLTLGAFWDSSLGDYWRSRIPPSPDSIRHVALPPLIENGKPMYGGTHFGRGVLGSWFFTNVQPGAPCRNSFTFLHEWAHSFSIRDSCDGPRPNVLCAEDASIYRDCKAPARFTATQERQIRLKLGLRAGRTMVIGK